MVHALSTLDVNPYVNVKRTRWVSACEDRRIVCARRRRVPRSAVDERSVHVANRRRGMTTHDHRDSVEGDNVDSWRATVWLRDEGHGSLVACDSSWDFRDPQVRGINQAAWSARRLCGRAPRTFIFISQVSNVTRKNYFSQLANYRRAVCTCSIFFTFQYEI